MKYRRKIFLSIMSLLLLATTFASTTYAWFKINSNAEISGFDFKVEGANGILVSTDNIHFSSDLTKDSLTDAMILKKNNQYHYNDDGVLVNASNIIVSDAEKKNEISNILLLPVTSFNGYDLTDRQGAKIEATSGRYIEFDLYFKAASETISDGSYDISLFLSDKEKTDTTMNRTIRPTSLSSENESIKLVTDMNTIKGEIHKGESISVSTLNAIRFSTVSTYETFDLETNENKEITKNQIYEFYNDEDLGSYPVTGNTNSLYNPETNASFTYYNNQKASKINALSMMPDTYRYKLGTIPDSEAPIITNVKCNGTSNLVTLRFWLEGWDADCFDGLSKSIKVSLTFTSKQIKNVNVSE